MLSEGDQAQEVTLCMDKTYPNEASVTEGGLMLPRADVMCEMEGGNDC